jgi:hypothetical protein
MQRLIHLLLVLACGHTAMAQTQFQLLLDTLSGTMPIMRHSIVTEDGRAILAFPRNNGTMLVIANLDGNPTAAFNLDIPIYSGGSSDLVANPGGGAVMATLALIDDLAPPQEPFDSARVSFKVCSFGPLNTVEWARTYSFDSETSFSSGPGAYNTSVELKTTADAIFLGIRSGSLPARDWFFKISPNGALQWSVALQESASNSNVPMRISPALDGGLYFAHRESDAANRTVVVGRLSTDGDLLWQKSYDYTNNAITMELNDLVTTQEGHPMCISGLVGFGLGYGYLLRVSADGNAFDGHFYQTSSMIDHWFRSAQMLDNGDFLVFSNQGYWTRDAVLLRLDADLNVLHDARVSRSMVGNVEFSMHPTSFTADGDQVVLAGSVRMEDQIFGYLQHRPSIWKFDLTDPDGCMTEDTMVTHYEIPSNLIDVEDLMPNVAVDTPPDSTSEETLALTPVDLIPTLSLCEQLVGVDESRSTELRMSASPNPVYRSQAVQVDAPGTLIFEIRSATGALLAMPVRADLSGKAQLNADLPSGAYSVIARDRSGATIGRVSLMVL